MEPMMRASIGGASPGNQEAATDPVETSTASPIPEPRTSNAISRAPPGSTSTSRKAPFGMDETF